MAGLSLIEMATHPFQTDDARLHPIKDKVLTGERLTEADLRLYVTIVRVPLCVDMLTRVMLLQ